MKSGLLLALLAIGCKVKLPAAHEDAACARSDQCPAAESPCLLSQCLEGRCVFVPAPQGPLPAQDQQLGDCKQLFCDGDGNTFAQAARLDAPRDDGNPCTESLCDVAVPRHAPKAAGLRCGQDGLCNGKGHCGVCLPGTTRCQQDGIARCSAEGAWSAARACPAARPVCGGDGCLGVAEIAAGARHACARLEDGSVRCWGSDERGQLSDPHPRPFAGVVGAADFGWRHACAAIGTTAECWGAGDFGQLGDGGFSSSDGPVKVDVAAAEVAVGADHSCARTPEGEVWCWGRNDRGQLGSGPQAAAANGSPPAAAGEARLRPVPLAGAAKAARLALDAGHSCILASDGATRCWGLRPFAPPPELTPTERAARKRTSRPKPAKIAGISTAVELACGDHHCCARLRDGTVTCWGAGDRGQLGAGVSDSARPRVVEHVARATRLAIGADFGCALTEEGSLLCWGANDRGQLGRGLTDARGPAAPVPLGDAVQDFALGDAFGCALTHKSGLSCWGAGAAGQLGAGKREDAAAPVRVAW